MQLDRIAKLFLPVLLIAATSVVCDGATLTVSSPDRVEDAALWSRDFSARNFGQSPLLEVGYVAGLYELHRSVSLIRFDLRGLTFEKVDRAMLRLYKPRSFVQRYPVNVEVYEVCAGNGNWQEGSGEASRDGEGACWDGPGDGRPWVAKGGLGMASEDYEVPALDVARAPSDRGQWLELSIPAEIVKKWLDHPADNAGLLIRTHDDAMLAEHCHFYSSEHHSGKGPQLIIQGTTKDSHVPRRSEARDCRHAFPSTDDPAFLRWLDAADNRYTAWVRDYEMTIEQALQIYYYDVVVRGELLMPRVRVPMFQTMRQMEARIRAGDESGVRDKLREIRQLLLTWEYIRQTQWYDSGPLADVLSPLQLAWLYAKPAQGIFPRIDAEGKNFREFSETEVDAVVERQLQGIRKDLRLSERQYEKIAPDYEQFVRQEYHYRQEIHKDLDHLSELIAQARNDADTLDWVGRLHMDHDLFLYYQSLFDTPRWDLLMTHADAIPLAQIYLRVRGNQHTPGRTRRQIDHAARYDSANGRCCAAAGVALVTGQEASLPELAAVELLRNSLATKYPDAAFVLTSDPAHDGAAILLGTFESLPVLEVYVRPADLATEKKFCIRDLPRCRNPRLVVAGQEGQAVMMAVDDLVEELGTDHYTRLDSILQQRQSTVTPAD